MKAEKNTVVVQLLCLFLFFDRQASRMSETGMRLTTGRRVAKALFIGLWLLLSVPAGLFTAAGTLLLEEHLTEPEPLGQCDSMSLRSCDRRQQLRGRIQNPLPGHCRDLAPCWIRVPVCTPINLTGAGIRWLC
jgi:hypothetical protein